MISGPTWWNATYSSGISNCVLRKTSMLVIRINAECAIVNGIAHFPFACFRSYFVHCSRNIIPSHSRELFSVVNHLVVDWIQTASMHLHQQFVITNLRHCEVFMVLEHGWIEMVSKGPFQLNAFHVDGCVCLEEISNSINSNLRTLRDCDLMKFQCLFIDLAVLFVLPASIEKW